MSMTALEEIQGVTNHLDGLNAEIHTLNERLALLLDEKDVALGELKVLLINFAEEREVYLHDRY